MLVVNRGFCRVSPPLNQTFSLSLLFAALQRWHSAEAELGDLAVRPSYYHLLHQGTFSRICACRAAIVVHQGLHFLKVPENGASFKWFSLRLHE